MSSYAGAAAPSGPSRSRMWVIDLLKLLAANLIVLHHLSAYGPLSRAVAEHWPRLMSWLYFDGRLAVQVFLVIGGYLAASGFSSWLAKSEYSPWRTLWQRYVRLALPLMAAVLLAVLCSELARQWMVDDAIPASPQWTQVFSHALLLQDLLGHEALSAGVWYVAIDFQLFVSMVLIAWGVRRWGSGRGEYSQRWGLFAGQALVLALMLASLFVFNRHPSLDHLGLYFFGSYGLGAAVFWVVQGRRPWLGLLALAGVFAGGLWFDFRERIALALAVAMFLGCVQVGAGFRLEEQGRLAVWARLATRWAPVSYALFLVHFPMCLLANALFVAFGDRAADLEVEVLVLTWLASWLVAWLFYRRVELPLVNVGCWLADVGLWRWVTSGRRMG